MQNPQQGMEQMFGNNPVFQQARKMAEGKSPEQMKETVLNQTEAAMYPYGYRDVRQ